jgi:Flp pilus assembly protein TadD
MAGLTAVQVGRLQGVARAIRDGALARAQELLLDLSRTVPDHPEVLRLGGIALNRQERFADARALLERAARSRPDDALLLSDLGTALAGCGEPRRALELWRRACALEPKNPLFWFNLGRNLQIEGESEEAAEALTHAAELAPRFVPARVLLGNALAHLGRFDEASQSYRQAIALEPTCGDAWHGLSNIKTRPLEEGDLATLEALLARPTLSEPDRIAIAFALGNALEDHRRYAEAYRVLCEANASSRRLAAWDRAAHSRQVDAVLAACERLPAPRDASLGKEVIFVVSLPRSGSTLFEQILAAHPQVEGASELTTLDELFHEESRARAKPFPAWVADAGPEDWARLGRLYLERTAQWRRNRPRHTDKMPENWIYAGLLRAMLPGAAVIDARRDPLEVCWSCFKQRFFRVPHFSNDFEDLAAYLGDYLRAMDRFSALSPAQVRPQRYEDLLAQPEAEVRSLLAFCGLEFDPACLEFHRAARSVRTASAAQVRQPLRSNTARSERYGPVLDPLRRALGLLP